MGVSIEDIKKLRDRTCCGISDCKNALVEAEGDFEKAIDILRKRGLKVAAKRADMETKEGVAFSAVNAEKNFGVSILLACETDFVATNAMFVETASKIAELAAENKIKSLDELKSFKCGDLSVEEMIVDLMSKMTENISLSNFEFLEEAIVCNYTHFNKKIAVLVGINNVDYSEAVASLGKNLAMQVAAFNPVAVCRDCVPQEIIDRETEIAREQSAGAKNEDIAQKMTQGKLEKFFKENTLMEQGYILDEKTQVKNVINRIAPNMEISGFKRISIS